MKRIVHFDTLLDQVSQEESLYHNARLTRPGEARTVSSRWLNVQYSTKL